ncbi:MAG: hypothetical protein RJA07_2040 [Bacteroidota bacterium]|jgi:hypothetical protein
MKKIIVILFSFLFAINAKAQTNNISGYWSVLADFTDTSYSRNYSNSLYPFNRKSNIIFDENNNLYTNGYLVADSLAKYVVKWDGLKWNKLGNDSLAEFNYTFDNANLFASAASIIIDTFKNIYAIDWVKDSTLLTEGKVGLIKKWNGIKWTIIGRQQKSYYPFPKMISDRQGNLYVLGNYYDTSSTLASISLSVSKWDGISWSEYGDYNKLDAGYLTDIKLDSNQLPIIAGAIFDSTFSVLKSWSGNNWTNIGSGFNPMKFVANPSITGIFNILINNNLYYAYGDAFIDSIGKFYFNKFNGNVWSRMDTFPANLNAFSIDDLETDSSSVGIFACGRYADKHGYNFVGYWNDTSWLKYPNNAMLRFKTLNNSDIENVELDNKGRIYISGEYQLNGNIHGYIAYFNPANIISLNTLIFSSRKALNNSSDTIQIKHQYFSSNYNFKWLKNGIPQNINDTVLTVHDVGIYSILITDSTNGFQYSNELEISIQLPKYFFDTIKICNGDSLFFNGRFLTKGGDYSDTLKALNNIDSIRHLSLIVLAKAHFTYSASICSTDSFYFHSHFIKLNGIYSDTIKSYNTCDSIITLNLKVNQPSLVNLSSSICKGDSVFFNGNYKNQTGIYYDTLINLFGCDSIVSIDLNVIDIKSDFIIRNDSMISNHNNGILNWINCSTNTIVSSDTVFVPNDTLYYALILTKAGCSDTSKCKRISFLNSISNDFIKNNDIEIYPNPFNDFIMVECKNPKLDFIEILSLQGISKKTFKVDSNYSINKYSLFDLQTGTYLLKIHINNGLDSYRILQKVE